MIKCELCGQLLKNCLGLPSHLKHKHCIYTVQSYYDEFFKKENEGICVVCGNPTPFITVEQGYRFTF